MFRAIFTLFSSYKNKKADKILISSLLTLFLVLNLFIYNTMKKGTVKFFNSTKGFGFVVDEESKEEYFVHVSGLIDEINEGDSVEFELQEGRKGLNAVNVKVV